MYVLTRDMMYMYELWMGDQDEAIWEKIGDRDKEVSAADREMAREIANFIASRAFSFDDHECRAWALTDFGVWATLSGHEPELNLSEPG